MEGSLQKKGSIWYAVISKKEGNKFKTKWISTKCKGKTEAGKVLRNILNDLENDTYIEPSKQLFSDFMIEWLDNVIKPQIEMTTWDGYNNIIKKHIVPYFLDKCIKLTDLKTIHLQKYFDEKYKSGLSGNYLKRHRACMKKALDYAVRMEIIRANHITNVIMPKRKKFEVNYYSTEELEELIKVSKGTKIETAILLGVYFGLRRGEILGLRWQDIDFNNKTINICNTRTKVFRKVEKAPKSESSKRVLPLLPILEKHLRALSLKQKQDKLLFGNTYDDNDYVVKYITGKPVGVGSIDALFKKILIKNNLKNIRLHDLRHSNASFLLKQGLSLKEIQVWLGHANYQTTANIYAHVDSEMKKNTANAIEKLFAKTE